MVAKEEKLDKGTVREFGVDMYTLLYLKWIASKDLLYSIGNSAQYSEIAYMEGFHCGSGGKESAYNAGDTGFYSQVRKIPW